MQSIYMLIPTAQIHKDIKKGTHYGRTFYSTKGAKVSWASNSRVNQFLRQEALKVHHCSTISSFQMLYPSGSVNLTNP